MSTSTIIQYGKTTIPENIREYLHLREGDTVTFLINSQGQVVLQPIAKRRLTDLKGLLGAANKTVSLEEMEHAIRERGSQK